jgi:death on curing protein
VSEPRFLRLEEVGVIHEAQLEAFGGQAGVRSEPMLLSALAMPEQTFSGAFLHAFPFEMAAAYAFHIAENQPFVDGNKRTALHCAIEFLKFTGFEVDDPKSELYDAMMAIANHQLTKDGLAKLFEKLARPHSTI